jgi:hypothetical protein
VHSAAKAISRAAGDELIGETSRPMYRSTNFRPKKRAAKTLKLYHGVTLSRSRASNPPGNVV